MMVYPLIHPIRNRERLSRDECHAKIGQIVIYYLDKARRTFYNDIMNTNNTTLNRPYQQRWGFIALLLVVLLVFSLALAACGGDSAPGTEVESQPTEAVADAPPPTEQAAIDPDPTMAAEPTAPPEPTAVPDPTEPATELPVLAGPGDCNNPFMPVIEGRQLRYANSDPELGVNEYTMTYSDVTDTSFITTLAFDDGEGLVQYWQCLDGGLLSPQMIQMPGADMGVTFEYGDVEGLTLAPPDQMRPGGSWTTRFTSTASMSDFGSDDMSMLQETEMVNNVTAIESITVPAGTFPNAVRVDTNGTITISITMGDMVMPGEGFNMTFTSWYVEGVGLVRQVMTDFLGEGEEIESVTELIAIEN